MGLDVKWGKFSKIPSLRSGVRVDMPEFVNGGQVKKDLEGQAVKFRLDALTCTVQHGNH